MGMAQWHQKNAQPRDGKCDGFLRCQVAGLLNPCPNSGTSTQRFHGRKKTPETSANHQLAIYIWVIWYVYGYEKWLRKMATKNGYKSDIWQILATEVWSYNWSASYYIVPWHVKWPSDLWAYWSQPRSAAVGCRFFSTRWYETNQSLVTTMPITVNMNFWPESRI